MECGYMSDRITGGKWFVTANNDDLVCVKRTDRYGRLMLDVELDPDEAIRLAKVMIRAADSLLQKAAATT